MSFRPPYLLAAAVIFAALTVIEARFDSGFVRQSVGDAIVVLLVYAVLMAFSHWHRVTCAVLALAIAYAVELSQALNVVERVGLTPNRLTNVIFGSTFTWGDILAYTIGMSVGLLLDQFVSSRAVA